MSSGSVTASSRQTWLGTILVLTAGICWGMISIFIRQLNVLGLNSMETMFCRAWGAAILLAIYFLVKDPSLFRIRLRDIWMFFGTGVVSLTFFTYCYFNSILMSGAAVAVVLLYTSPIFVMLFSALIFHEKITSLKMLALGATFLGCALTAGLVGLGVHLTPFAFLLGLGSGIGYAAYSIFAGIATRRYTSLTISFYTFLFSGIAVSFLIDVPKLTGILAEHALDVFPYVIGLAAVCTALPYIAYTSGLGRMEASRAAVLVTIEPVVGTLLGIFAYHEKVTGLQIAGILLIFAAVLVLSIKGGDSNE